jgi:hypothetical protein
MSNTFKQKLELIELVISELGKDSVKFKGEIIIEKYIDAEDVLSEDFENRFLKSIFRETYPFSKPEELFIKIFQDSRGYNSSYDLIGNAIIKKLSEEEMKKVADKYFKFIPANKEAVSFSNFTFVNSDSAIKNYVIQKVIEEKELGKLIFGSIGIDKLTDLFNNILITSDIKTINLLIAMIEENKINYTNLPLVILNDKIKEKEKIQIIKSTYKQKDIIKYTNFIKDNLENLNYIDSFIEATIIQNNRIKEKDRAIFDLIRRVFVGTRGNNSSIDFGKMKNKSEFFKKYRKYFPIEKCSELMSDKSYYSRRNSKEFIAEMYQDCDLSTKLDLVNAESDLSRNLFKNIDKMMENIQGEQDKGVKARLFIFYANNNGRKETLELLGNQNISTIVSESEELVAGTINGMINLYEDESYWRELSSQDKIRLILSINEANLMSDRIKIFSGGEGRRNKRTNEEVKFRLKSFGLYDTSDSGHWSSGPSSHIKQYNNIIKSVAVLLTEASNANKEYVKAKVFKELVEPMLDDSYINSDLLSLMSKQLDTKAVNDIISDFKEHSGKPDSEVIGEYVFKAFLKLVEMFYPEHFEEISSNLKKLENSIRIIINI